MNAKNPFLTTARAAKLLGVTDRQVRNWCTAGRIEGAFKQGRDWVIPNPPKVTEKQT